MLLKLGNPHYDSLRSVLKALRLKFRVEMEEDSNFSEASSPTAANR
jgi:DNA-binding phage protein